MEAFVDLLFIGVLVALSYAASSVLYWIYFVNRWEKGGKWGTRLLGVGVCFHTVSLGVRMVQLNRLPFSSLSEGSSFFVWLLALAYLYLERRLKERALGPLITAIVAGVQMGFLFSNPPGGPPPELFRTPLFTAHVSAALLSYAFFAISFVSSLAYTLLLHEIQSKRLTFFYVRLPSLEMLDRLSRQAILAGFFFLTVGIAVGTFWALRTWGSFSDPKYMAAVATWLIYLVYIYTYSEEGMARKKRGLLGDFRVLLYHCRVHCVQHAFHEVPRVVIQCLNRARDWEYQHASHSSGIEP